MITCEDRTCERVYKVTPLLIREAAQTIAGMCGKAVISKEALFLSALHPLLQSTGMLVATQHITATSVRLQELSMVPAAKQNWIHKLIHIAAMHTKLLWWKNIFTSIYINLSKK